MTPQEQGRFCGSCRKTVVDFSVMTDKEVLDYFSKTSQHVCGRFSNDQLNKELTITGKKKRFSLAYIWNVILVTLLITEANAQVKPKPKKPVKTIIREEPMIQGKVAWAPKERVETIIPVDMTGRVLDAKTNQPVIGASISIEGTSGGTMADTSGNFRLKLEKKGSLVLVFSAVGYEIQTRVLDNLTNWQNIRVYLKPAATELQGVSVIGYGTIKGRVIMGAISSGYKVTKSEKINRVINNWMPDALKKDVKVYPNPVVRGNSIQVSLALKQAGDYKLEVLNTAGQVILIQPLLMQTKEQLIDVHTSSGWSAGIYWIRISAPGIKNVYQGKVVLQ